MSSLFMSAQIGFGTSAPEPESLMDVYSESKGVLLPRISITDFDSYNLPAGTQTESLLLYNTNATLGKGFTYWNGSSWNHVNNNFFWSAYGDGNLSSSQYLGTADNNSFLFGTSGISRLHFTINQRLESHANGTVSNPAWSMIDDGNGIYTIGNDLRFALDHKDFISVAATNSVTINPTQENIDLSVQGSTTSMLQMDASTNGIAIAASSPVEASLHVQGAASTVRFQNLSSSHSYNNGVDKSLLFVNSDGELILESTPHVTQLPQFEFESAYLSSSVNVRNTAQGAQTVVLHSTTEELFEDGLLEVVYQTSISVRNYSGGAVNDGRPRKYGIRVKVDGRVIGQTSKMYTSNGTGGPIASGFMYLNGKGYIPLTGSSAGNTYAIEVELFVDGGGNSTWYSVGSSSNDFFEVIVHY
ncbi:hypothetical protein FNJ87_03295 [Nonlabens mediterrranea]|uniref:Uncharacterized protein n=1 Tax=Nonlabens mediterrranea TaxID=1419947 RepID=A0ABS0A441_9FLAO|nr:hypothetical protein [Nonlabens mediterrranea]